MAQPKRGLGKGLGALIPTGPPASVSTAGVSAVSPARGPALADEDFRISGAYLDEIAVDVIRPNPRQPRQSFDEDGLADLAASIEAVGLLQPVIVRSAGPDGYELIMGERRLRACQLAGITIIPAIVRQTSDDDLLRNALIENLHREQLNPLEEAAAYQQLLEDFSATHDELARRIGRSRPHISNTIRLLNLPPSVQRRVAAGVLSAGHARALLGVEDPAAQEELARRIVAEGLSGRAWCAPGQGTTRTWRENSSRSGLERPRGPAIGRLRDTCQSRTRSAQGQNRRRVRLAGRSGAHRAHHVAGADVPPGLTSRRGDAVLAGPEAARDAPCLAGLRARAVDSCRPPP
jgi:ParB family transcriptional regulator, chromosome partitioning protein